MSSISQPPPPVTPTVRTSQPIWFCSVIPVPPGEGPCWGGDDVLPDPKQEQSYVFSGSEGIQTFPKSAIFLKNKDTQEKGFIVPDTAVKQVKKLIFKVNGKHTYEVEDPFRGKGIDAMFLWWTGILKESSKQKILDLMAKDNLDISRVNEIELVGLTASPLELSK